MSKLLKHFPVGVVPRPQQIQALEKIEEIWASGKKIAIGCLPTGAGKSHIAKTVGESSETIDSTLKGYIEDYSIYKTGADGGYSVAKEFLDAPAFGSFILTITKSLQDQYQNLFMEGAVMKGKSNFFCDIDDELTVDVGVCLTLPQEKQKCFSCDCCSYYKSRNSGLIHKSPVLNYSMFLNLPEFLQKREILVMDEAAELEDALVSQYSLNLKYNTLRKNGIVKGHLKNDDLKVAYTWLQDIEKELNVEYDDALADAQSSMGSGKTDAIRKVKFLTDLINKVALVVQNWKRCEYMVEIMTKDEVTFAPYNVKVLARNIFDRADKVLMMSATLSDVEEYTKSLGITKEEYGYFEVASGFDPKKSPIVCSKKYCLSYKTMDQLLPKLVKSAIELCEQHKDENGLIHTHSFKITQEFKKQIGDDPRYLFREDGVTNEDIIGLHFNAEHPTVLISPSMGKGVSLDDALGRFQIICKAPYLPLGSKRIAKMFKETPKLYAMKMLDSIIQMAGRCTRSIDDHSTTYILDGTAVNSVQRSSRTLPRHFLDRFV